MCCINIFGHSTDMICRAILEFLMNSFSNKIETKYINNLFYTLTFEKKNVFL